MRETGGESTAFTVEATPSLDVIFDILSNQRRRDILYYLNDQPNGVATIDELVDVVVTHDRSSGDPTVDPDEQRRRIDTELRHVHVPKLAGVGIVDHDRRTETVRYWTQPSVTEWLEHAQHKERS